MIKIIVLFFYIISCSFVYAQSYNVKHFGAVGNGKNDDSHAIQKCIDKAARSGGGIVYFPKGTYIVSRTSIPGKAWCIRSGNNIEFRGENNKNTILKLAGKQKNFTRILYLENVKNILINKITFDGNVDEQPNPTKPNEHLGGIYIDNAENVNIADSRFENTGGDGISIRGTKLPSNNIVINNCFFSNNQRNGITLGSGFDGVKITNCYFDKSIDDSPIDSEPTSGICQNVVIENNKIFTPTLLTIGGPNDSNTGKNYIIRSNYLENCGIFMVNAENILIEDNTIISENPIRPAFTVITYNKKITIRNNNVKIYGKDFLYAVFTQYTNKAANEIKIIDNNIKICGKNLNAFHLRGVSGVDIYNNNIEMLGGKDNRAVYIHANYPMKEITVRNNKFIGLGKGIEVVGTPKKEISGIVVEDNDFQNSGASLVPLKVNSRKGKVDRIVLSGNKKNNVLHNKY